ncbi:MAG: ABC transporter permease [Clostridia bacterium]|nr:ABC transporter permease [Clostridia bacterium]
MNSFSIAFTNLKNNLKAYGVYLTAMILSVAVYYNFLASKDHPDILKAEAAFDYVEGTSQAVSFLLLVFLIFFIWFSNSFFLSLRKKEIGIFAFMGISNSQIGLIIAIEMLFQGIVAIAAGLMAGMLFGKLFMMLLARVALLNVKITFFISGSAALETGITFLVIFFLVSVKGYFEIAKSKLIDLFNAARKEELPPKVSILKGVFSLLFLGVGYYAGVQAGSANFLVLSVTAVVFVVWGTYWLFGSFLSIIIRYLITKKQILYWGVNIVSLSNIAFRMKRSYRVLATIAVLAATTITAFGTVTSLYYYVKETHGIEHPYSFSYIIGATGDEKLKDQVKSIIHDSSHTILLEEQSRFLLLDKYTSNYNFSNKMLLAVKFSEFERVLKDLKFKKADQVALKYKPSSGEALFVEKPGVMFSLSDQKIEQDIQLYGTRLKVTTNIKAPLFGSGLPAACLVVTDRDYAALEQDYMEYQFNGIIVSRPEKTETLTTKLFAVEPLSQSLYTYSYAYKQKFEYIGIVYFLGSFMCLVFILATASIMYFKTLSDALVDKGKYEILSKIGMSEEEIAKAVSKQVGISFALPLVIGSIHSFFAIRSLQVIMNYNLLIPTLISVLAIALVYCVFYLAVTKSFLRIILSS